MGGIIDNEYRNFDSGVIAMAISAGVIVLRVFLGTGIGRKRPCPVAIRQASEYPVVNKMRIRAYLCFIALGAPS